jgi:regulator of sirC expression with transglutaminase-like and TPR domain
MIAVQEKLQNLFRLVDDDSAEIQKILRQQLLENAIEVMFNRLNYIETLNEVHIDRFRAILDEIHIDLVLHGFRQIKDISLEDIDLEKCMLLLSYWNDNNANISKTIQELDSLADEISIGIPTKGHPLGFIDHINYYLFVEFGFAGKGKDNYNPDSYYLNHLLTTKKGIPITISIFYMLIAKRLGFPVYGVSLPEHFVLKFYNDEDEIFFDPFNGGKIYSKEDCLDFFKNTDYRDFDSILNGCSNLEVFRQILDNLYQMFSTQENVEKRNQVKEIITVFS